MKPFQRQSALWQTLTDMDFREKTVFIMSGLRSGYLREWNTVFEKLLDFIYVLFKTWEHYDNL